MRIVIVGAGFAGFHAARRLHRTLGRQAEIVVINPTDYFLYVPLLPQVTAAVLDPRRVTIPITTMLPNVKFVTGTVTGVDLDAKTVTYRHPGKPGPRTPHDQTSTMEYDQVLITSGSVNKLLPIPGVAEHATGYRDLAEAVYLRDHLLEQLELADATDDPHERTARLTFVVVGAGYTGTEVAAQSARMVRRLLRHHPRLSGCTPRWMLLDTAPRVLPGLSEHLSKTADRALRRLGVDVAMGMSVKEATADGVELTDGSSVDTRSLVWCVGVRPDPLVSTLNVQTAKGRLVVEDTLSVPGRTDAWACGDAAAVPDLTRPGEVTAMTAQHAQRQGVRVADNIAAGMGHGKVRAYRHKNLGFVVDLGGLSAAADPLGVPLGGLPAAVATRGYHLFAMPGNRVRTAIGWLENALLGPQELQLHLVDRPPLPLDTDSNTSHDAKSDGAEKADRKNADQPKPDAHPSDSTADPQPSGSKAAGAASSPKRE